MAYTMKIKFRDGQAVDFSIAEERLSLSLPRELKQIYAAIHNHEVYFTGVEHFLPLDEIYTEQDDVCCYRFCVGRMFTIALENKPVTRKGRCKGSHVTTLNIERELDRFCIEKYHLLSELNMYGIASMYSDEKLLAWIRSNGFYADIHAGADDEAHLDAFGEHLGQITWKQTPQK